MKEQSVIDVVYALNCEIDEITDDENCNHFDINTNGYVIMVNFLGTVVWDSDNDEREWIESEGDYEPLNLFLKKAANREIEKLQKQKFLETVCSETSFKSDNAIVSCPYSLLKNISKIVRKADLTFLEMVSVEKLEKLLEKK